MRKSFTKLIPAIYFLLYINFSTGQNVGIGTSTPLQKLHVQGNTFIHDSLSIGIDSAKAALDVKGTVLFRGEHTNPFTPATNAAVEFATGNPYLIPGASSMTKGDIALSYGGQGGGFRHFISSNHNPEQGSNNYNSISFFLNSSYAPNGSQRPGIGNKLAMTLTNNGLGLGASVPQAKLHVNGNTLLIGKTLVGNPSTYIVSFESPEFEVSGAAVFKGGNYYVPISYPRAGVEFVFGRDANGILINPFQNPDIAFNYGDEFGGFRHFITTRHENSSNSAGNSFDFFVNNVTNREGSFAPGAGNKLVMSVTGAGVGIGKNNPLKPIDIVGDGEISGSFTIKKSLNTDTITSGPKLYLQSNNVVAGKLTVNDTLFVNKIAPETLQSASLQNGWVNHGGGFADAGYWKDKEGMVHLQGLIRFGTTDLSTVLFTLPPGYRPNARHIFTVLSNNVVTRIDILGNGDVILANTTSNIWLSLSGISFRTN